MSGGSGGVELSFWADAMATGKKGEAKSKAGNSPDLRSMPTLS